LATRFKELEEVISELEGHDGKKLVSNMDFSKVSKTSDDFSSALKKINKELTNLQGKSDKQLERFLPKDILDDIDKTTEAIKIYKRVTKELEG
jgi:flagellar hook-basal body complex protein FliE